jgi:hypothetical protein
MKTPEQIAARKAKSKARREAKKVAITVNDENRAVLKKAFKKWMDAFEAGTLTVAQVKLTNSTKRPASQMSKEEVEAKIKKEQARLERLNALLQAK